ncbi:hypothetical protein B0H67DRAFT_83420 [Lasiosphaeris hirsuta]|uniref:Uncharacterized protein n=1 Tax=Lasiosphaeris hirsuta TaxID=260670 RepID=A0AA40BCH1_9PEZI|nr:hypothetical protein B0H67DRAFT_83420 [Lasiosphaeris hirsuta]
MGASVGSRLVPPEPREVGGGREAARGAAPESAPPQQRQQAREKGGGDVSVGSERRGGRGCDEEPNKVIAVVVPRPFPLQSINSPTAGRTRKTQQPIRRFEMLVRPAARSPCPPRPPRPPDRLLRVLRLLIGMPAAAPVTPSSASILVQCSVQCPVRLSSVRRANSIGVGPDDPNPYLTACCVELVVWQEIPSSNMASTWIDTVSRNQSVRTYPAVGAQHGGFSLLLWFCFLANTPSLLSVPECLSGRVAVMVARNYVARILLISTPLRFCVALRLPALAATHQTPRGGNPASLQAPCLGRPSTPSRMPSYGSYECLLRRRVDEGV